ncbi:hypothetical protein HZB78_02160 [Candidatus Collierbacteria bacterium]|nr:hypothetical protein [Candidatus Collierbacteria bacterium]
MKKYFGQEYFGRPLPAGAVGRRERSFVQNFRDEVQVSKQLDLAQLSAALLKQGEESGGSFGLFVALGGVIFLAAACGSAPTTGPEMSHTPSPTPDHPTPLPTHTLTPSPTHTLTPTSTLFPSRTPTFAAPEKPSQYSAADNNILDLVNGIARLDKDRYQARLTQSAKAIKADSNHRYLDYEAAMEFLKPPTDFWGKPKLPSRGPDFWITGNGGLGFSDSDKTHFGMGEVIDATPNNLLVKGGDDLYRGRLVVQQKYFEVALIQAARAAAKLRWPGEDFTKFGSGSALVRHDAEIQQLFHQILSDLGYEPVGGIRWPGAVDLKTLTEDELEQIVPDGNACVAERPVATNRSLQKPEQFRKVAFRGAVESRTPGQDENRNLVDKETDQVILVVVDPKRAWKENVRVEVLDAGASIDNLQSNRKGQSALDSEKVEKVAAALDRLVPCGPAKPGVESSQTPTSTATPDIKISLTPPKNGTSTPPKGTPGTPSTPGTPDKTQPPATPQNTPGRHESTPEGGPPTVVPPGPQPAGQPTFIPQPTEVPAPPKTVPTSTH